MKAQTLDWEFAIGRDCKTESYLTNSPAYNPPANFHLGFVKRLTNPSFSTDFAFADRAA